MQKLSGKVLIERVHARQPTAAAMSILAMPTYLVTMTHSRWSAVAFAMLAAPLVLSRFWGKTSR